MNLVGKIFTVLIFVMSILFMGFALAVYATHKNWKEVVTRPADIPGKEPGLIYQLKQLRTRNEELKAQKTRLEEKLAQEQKAALQVRAKLEQEADLLKRQYKNLRDENLKNIEAQRRMVAELATAQAATKALLLEIEGPDGKGGLRAEIKRTVEQRDAKLKEVVQLTDELHERVNELKRLRQQQVTLAEENARAMEVLRKFGLKPEPELYAGVPPDVNGFVLAVTGEGSEILVEISIGADDGLQKKHRLHVFRPGPGPYVGDVEVVETYPDKVVCTIVPKTLKSPMRRGDYVTSRLR